MDLEAYGACEAYRRSKNFVMRISFFECLLF